MAVREVAREILTAHWTAFERRTQDAADTYAEALGRGLDDPETAAHVLDEMARIAVSAVVLQAAARDVPYEQVFAELFTAVDEARDA